MPPHRANHGRQGLTRASLAAACLTASIAATSLMVGSASADTIKIPGDTTYPESITSTADGTVIIGSLGSGEIWRVASGADTAELWIKPGTNGLLSVLGVLADERASTLWVCSSDLSEAGVKIAGGQKPVALKSFDLKTGAVKASIPLPGDRTLCNDMVTAGDGTLYVTDSFSPHILRLKPDAKQFEVWAEDPRFSVKDGAGLDGIAIGADGNIYTNTFNGGGLFRVEMRKDGSAGTVTQLLTSRKLVLPDGLRSYGDKLLMIEGEGRLDLVSIDGDKAHIEVLRDGYKAPVSVTKVGRTLWVLEGQLPHLFDPKTGKPDPFSATSITAPPGG